MSEPQASAERPRTAAEEHRRGRRQASSRDLLLAMAILLVPVVLIVWLFSSTPDEPPLPTQNAEPVIASARAEAGFAVPAPVAVPAGWRVTRAQWAQRGDRWTADSVAPADQLLLNYVTADDINLQLWVSNEAVKPLISRVGREGVEDGTSDLTNGTWTRYLSEDGRTRALLQSTGGANTVVVSDGDWTLLESFAATLTTS